MKSRLIADQITELRDCGYMLQTTCRRKLINILHSHDFYEITFQIEGDCMQEINSISFPLYKDNIIIMKPGDTHVFTSQSENADLFALSVVEPEMQKFIAAYGEKLRQTICDTEYPHVFSLSVRQRYELMTEYERTKILDIDQKVMHYKIMLGKLLHNIMLSPELSPVEASPNRFWEKINEFHTIENIAEGVPALIRLTNFSPAHLGRLMKTYLGMTPHQYAFTKRMNMAYSLVSNTSLSFDEISEKVGYASFSHFNQAFKRKFRITPSKLRKRLDVRTV